MHNIHYRTRCKQAWGNLVLESEVVNYKFDSQLKFLPSGYHLAHLSMATFSLFNFRHDRLNCCRSFRLGIFRFSVTALTKSFSQAVSPRRYNSTSKECFVLFLSIWFDPSSKTYVTNTLEKGYFSEFFRLHKIALKSSREVKFQPITTQLSNLDSRVVL